MAQPPQLQLQYRVTAPWRTSVALKRIVDIVGGTVAFLITLPLLLIACVAVMIESPGPPFFVHRRIGRFGRELRVLKLRTMVPNAEQHLERLLSSDPVAVADWNGLYKIRHDPRITRVGKVLRKLSIDELPQLVNVLLGQMSLVGPRPIVLEEFERFGANRSILVSVRPGLTCLWAVSGRGDLPYEDRMRLELSYVLRWSFWLDARILLKTIPAVLRRTGAY